MTIVKSEKKARWRISVAVILGKRKSVVETLFSDAEDDGDALAEALAVTRKKHGKKVAIHVREQVQP